MKPRFARAGIFLVLAGAWTQANAMRLLVLTRNMRLALASARRNASLALEGGAPALSGEAERQDISRTVATLRATQGRPVCCPIPIY